MRKSLFAAAALGLILSVSGAQALDARAGKGPAAASAGVSVEVQLAGHRRGPGYRAHRLGPRQIVRRLHRQGFHRIGNPRPRGDVYVLRAHGPRGVPQRLVVDAYSGRIVGRTVIGARWGGPGFGRW